MTETRTQSRPPIPVGMAIGQAVGRAQSVMSRQLAGVCAGIGASLETYLALQRLALLGDEAGREDYVRDLSDSLALDLWSAGELANGLVADGLVTLNGETVRLAAAGAELRTRIAGTIGNITAPLYAQLDPADIETMVRTLQRLTTLVMESSAAPSATTGGR
ncbi:MAG TPA: hypothetical protein VH589_25700 [Trebonia sp.]